MRRDIDEALQGWPNEPEPGDVVAREIRARDGRSVLQVRVILGILQMEVEARPDGVRPHSFATYLDYLQHRSSIKNSGSRSKAAPWVMSAEHCVEADREFAQYYQRRIAWLTLHKYDKALLDADHSLALMDFVKVHGINPDYIASHERFRGLVLFHRTQASAALAIERARPDEAIDIVREGRDRIVAHHQGGTVDGERDDTPNEMLIEQLRILENEIRATYSVEKTLREQLDEAVLEEDYERAARLRDQIKARAGR